MRQALRALKTPVTLLLLFGLLAFGAWWGYTSVTAPVPQPPKSPCVPQRVNGVLKSSKVSVNVLNGSAERGLASRVAATLKARKFRIADVGNTERRITKTVVVGAARGNPEVKLVAAQFKGASIEADARPDHSVDVLVGRAFAGYAKARTSIRVASSTVCLPSPASPSPTVG